MASNGTSDKLQAQPAATHLRIWLETAPMEQRKPFIADHWRALFSMSELCDRYGTSRKTGYKWLERSGSTA
jgi:hypothetical protein